MAWKIEITPSAQKDLKKIGHAEAQWILKFLFERIHGCDNPQEVGDYLKGSLREFWRYRVGDYRILCHLENEVLTVLVVHIGHRREVYK